MKHYSELMDCLLLWSALRSSSLAELSPHGGADRPLHPAGGRLLPPEERNQGLRQPRLHQLGQTQQPILPRGEGSALTGQLDVVRSADTVEHLYTGPAISVCLLCGGFHNQAVESL